MHATEQVKTGEEQPPVGSAVAIHYDRNDPTSIVTDDSHTGRDVTLWIVAVKLVRRRDRAGRGRDPAAPARAGRHPIR